MPVYSLTHSFCGRLILCSFHPQYQQVAQLSQTDRAAGCVSFGQNIISGSPLATWVLSLLSTELDALVIAQVPVINASVLSNLCEYRHKSYIAKN